MKSIITYTAAINYVLENTELPEAIEERLKSLRDSIGKRNAHHGKAETTEKRNAFQKEKRAEARKAFLDKIVPVIRVGISEEPRTVKEIFERVKDAMPTDFTIAKLQYMLTHNELGDDVVKDDNGKNPRTYHL